MNIHDSDIRRVAFQEGRDSGFSEGEAFGIEKGISQGAEQAKIETAKNMIHKGIPLDTITECTGLPLEKIEELQKEIE